MIGIVALHAVGVPVFALSLGFGISHSILDGAPLALAVLVALLTSGRRRLSSAVVALGLLTSSALLVHVSGGVIEAHFHFFVVMALLALYEDWLPYLLALASVVIHHGLTSLIAPSAVFNHAAAIENPWKWALIHGGMVGAASVANIILWRLNEEVRYEVVRAHRQIGDSERQLRQAQEVARVGSWQWDPREQGVIWSDELYRLFGFEPDGEFVPTYDGFFAMVHPDDRDSLDSLVKDALVNPAPWLWEGRGLRRDGTEWIMQSRGNVLTDDQGNVVLMSGTAQDVTELRAADRSKHEFVSVVSHELRTPLTSIRGSLGLLAAGTLGPVPEQGQRMLEIAVSNTDRLMRLINDILDLERIQSGRIEIEPERVDAAELMLKAGREMSGMATREGVVLQITPPEAHVFADPDRVLQTLANLLSNAIKFSPRGATVSLAAEYRGDELLFSVQDHGRGIPAASVETIFERFQQVDSSDARQKGGTGLGLAICRSIVRQHGGEIWVESQLGKGSTFFFTLPTSRPHAQSSGAGVLAEAV